MRREGRSADGTPWAAEEVTRWVTRAGVGLALIAWAWFQANGEQRLQDQTTWANASVLGLVVLFHANLTFLVRARRRIGERRRRLLGDGIGVSAHVAEPVVRTTRFVAPVDGTRYHLEGCTLAANRRTVTESRAAHERAGRRPCGVCRP